MTEFAKASIEGGQLVKKNVRLVPQDQMTAECWFVQAWGLDYCKTCEYYGTEKKPHRECGGKNIRKTGKNEKGFSVPLGKEA